MAIPFYEPRKQPATGCDQIDGHFPPAPSSQSVPLPSANFSAPMGSNQASPSGMSTTPTAFSHAFITSRTSSTTAPNSATVTSSASSSPSPVTSAATATFPISSTNPANAASTSSSTSHSNGYSETSLPSSAATMSEPLPWKLLAVAMCKALKQYYQQSGSADVFTTAVIEILPSGVAGGAQQQSSAAGN